MMLKIVLPLMVMAVYGATGAHAAASASPSQRLAIPLSTSLHSVDWDDWRGGEWRREEWRRREAELDWRRREEWRRREWHERHERQYGWGDRRWPR